MAEFSDADLDRERDDEYAAELRAERADDTRLAARGLERRQCEICGDDLCREIGTTGRRCGLCMPKGFVTVESREDSGDVETPPRSRALAVRAAGLAVLGISDLRMPAEGAE